VDVARIEAAIAAARDAAKGEDLTAIRRTTEELQKASHAVAEQLYKQQAAGRQTSGADGQGSSEHDDVKEGEVVDA
jgi:molecular chaperone DnaK